MNIAKKLTVVMSAVVLMLGLAACEQGTDGPEAGANVDDLRDSFTAFEEDFGALEERVTAWEDRVAALEEEVGADAAVADETAEGGMQEEVLADPASFVGQEVTVSAEVQAVIDTHSFTLDGPQGPLLVTNATGPADAELVEDGAVVQVTGTVRSGFSVTDVEEEFGLELDDSLYTDFQDQHYIMATNVTEPAAADS